MRRKVTHIDEIAAAYLFAKENRTQAAIADLLGISPAVVSRLIAKARADQYLIQEFRFREEALEDDKLQAVRQRISRSGLAKALDEFSRAVNGCPGPTVRVFAIPGGSGRGADAMAEFATQAAPHIRDLIGRSRLCGVTWGRMLLNVVRALRKLRPVTRSEPLDVIPLAGEPLGQEPTTSSSSSLASALGRVINNNEDYHAKSLTMVPALVPRDFTEEECQAVFKLVERLPDYRDIFGAIRTRGAADTAAHQVDCIMTSLGHEALGFSGGALLAKAEEKLFVGDMGGVLFPRPDLEEEGRRVTGDIEARWTGLRQEHVKACAERARAAGRNPNAPPGVVLISIGEQRATVVFEAIKRRLLNHLVIDSQLELALSQLPELSLRRRREHDAPLATV